MPLARIFNGELNVMGHATSVGLAGLKNGAPTVTLTPGGGVSVEMSAWGNGKNVVLTPSMPDTSGFCCTSTPGSRWPAELNTLYDGPKELNPSLGMGVNGWKGATTQNGTAPT